MFILLLCLFSLGTVYSNENYDHIPRQQQPLPKFVCQTCQQKFSTITQLSRHILALHSITCPSCNGSFSNFNEFKEHVHEQHGLKYNEVMRIAEERDKIRSIKEEEIRKAEIEKIMNIVNQIDDKRLLDDILHAIKTIEGKK